MQRVLRCYAEGKGTRWEAICLDLDIAVQGESLREALDELTSAVQFHVEHILSLPQQEQDRFWNRRAPMSMRLRFLWHVLVSTFRSYRKSNGKERAELLIPCPA